MRISVRVKPNARRSEVKHLEGNNYLVSVAAPPVEGKANEEVIEALAEFFGKPKRAVTLLRGGTSKNKVFEVL